LTIITRTPATHYVIRELRESAPILLEIGMHSRDSRKNLSELFFEPVGGGRRLDGQG
jgi:hypothetical protein